MLNISARNDYGFSINFKNNEKFDIVDITGLDPVNATINSSSIPSYSGSVFNSAYVGNRNIVISIAYNMYNNVARQELNNCFIPSIPIRLYIDDYYIDGYTESVDYNPFNEKMIIQISIICLYPYFSLKNDITIHISQTISLFTFPFSIPSAGIPISEQIDNHSATIYNYTNVPTGCIIKIFFNEEVYGLRISNANNNQLLEIYQVFCQYDELTIDTRFAHKSIILTSPEYQEYNVSILDKLVSADKWIEIEPNENKILIEAYVGTLSANGIDAYLTYSEKIGGL